MPAASFFAVWGTSTLSLPLEHTFLSWALLLSLLFFFLRSIAVFSSPVLRSSFRGVQFPRSVAGVWRRALGRDSFWVKGQGVALALPYLYLGEAEGRGGDVTGGHALL